MTTLQDDVPNKQPPTKKPDAAPAPRQPLLPGDEVMPMLDPESEVGNGITPPR